MILALWSSKGGAGTSVLAAACALVLARESDGARLARDEDWPILQFARPIRLRDRVPVPATGPTIAATGVLAAAGTGVLVWWWLRRNRHHRRAA